MYCTVWLETTAKENDFSPLLLPVFSTIERPRFGRFSRERDVLPNAPKAVSPTGEYAEDTDETDSPGVIVS